MNKKDIEKEISKFVDEINAPYDLEKIEEKLNITNNNEYKVVEKKKNKAFIKHISIAISLASVALIAFVSILIFNNLGGPKNTGPSVEPSSTSSTNTKVTTTVNTTTLVETTTVDSNQTSIPTTQGVTTGAPTGAPTGSPTSMPTSQDDIYQEAHDLMYEYLDSFDNVTNVSMELDSKTSDSIFSLATYNINDRDMVLIYSSHYDDYLIDVYNNDTKEKYIDSQELTDNYTILDVTDYLDVVVKIYKDEIVVFYI